MNHPAESSMVPDETAVRLRADLRAADAMTFANALANAAECSLCAFYSSGECRAWPPRPLADGRAIWPKVSSTDWCGCWRAA
jgi:hypothetical protein